MNINLSNIAPDRLEELVLHIAAMSEKDTHFGVTKLNKLVFSADFEAFCETGRTITGASYQKGEYGPIPRAMPIILSRLQEEKRLELSDAEINAIKGKRPRAKASPNLTAFSQRDLSFVDKTIIENVGKTGTAMSRATHKELAHKVAEEGETIPFAAWLIRSRPPTEKEKRHGATLAARLKRHGAEA